MRDAVDIHADLLSQAINAGKSVANNSSNWQKGSNTANAIQQSINQGLLDAVTEIKAMDGTQATVIDKYGIHLREEKNGIVSPEQGWIVSNKFLYTDDNWKTTKSVFGKYTYKNEERWGILADSVVGGYLEGNEIEGGSIRIGDRGDGTYALVVTSDGTVQINSWGGALEDTINEIEAKPYEVVVESSTVPVFDNALKSTVLTCRIYKDYEEVVPIPTGTTFTWTRYSSDTTGDANWNSAHKDMEINMITITSDEIENSAQFSCEVNIP